MAIYAAAVGVGMVVGWAVGQLAQKGVDSQPLDTKVQGASIGQPLPLAYGMVRLAGNVIWSTPFVAHASSGGGGGKGGGGGATVTNYTYTISLAVAICANPILGVRRIWANGKLVYSVPHIASGNNLSVPIGGITVAYGAGTAFTTIPTVTATINGVTTDRTVEITAITLTTFNIVIRKVTYSTTPDVDVGGSVNWSASADLGPDTATVVAHNAAQTDKTIHLGSETQGVDSFIQSYVGVGHTPAYRGTSYVVFQNFNLDVSGNTLPNFEFEVIEATTSLSAVVADTCLRCGLTADEIDVTQLTDIIKGYVVAGRTAPRAALEPLAAAYFFDALEVDGLLRFVKRGTHGLAAVIPEGDLAAVSYGGTLPNQLDTTRKSELELPQEVSVQYQSSDSNYEQGSQYDRKVGTRSTVKTSTSIPVVLSNSEAHRIASTALHAIWTERMSFSFTVGRKYMYLDPTDIVAVSRGEDVYEIRLDSMDAAHGVIKLSGVQEDVGLYGTTLNTLLDTLRTPAPYKIDPGYVSTPLLVPAPPLMTVGGHEILIGVSSTNPNYGGCDVFVALDNLNFEHVGRLTQSSTIGVATTALGQIVDPDITSTLGINLTQCNGALYSVSRVAADAKDSVFYFDGEFISYQTATLTSAFNYNLTYLRRGVFNTLDLAHAIGAKFMRIDDKVLRYPYLESLEGQTIYFKFPAFNKYGQGGQSLANVPSYSHLVGEAIAYPSDVTGFLATNIYDGVILTWNPIVNEDVLEYEIRVGGTTWETATFLASAKATQLKVAPTIVGTTTWWIKATNDESVYSINASTASTVVTAAAAPIVTQQVVDNNVLLYWNEPLHIQPIQTYQISRNGVVVGTKAGLFTSLFETTAGTYTYAVAAVDIAGNVGTAGAVVATVNQPPDYVLNATSVSQFKVAELVTSTAVTNALPYVGGVVLPVNLTETFAQHFTVGHTWAGPSAQISAGLPLFMQPALASGSYAEVHDFGATIAGSKISLALLKTVTGTPTVTVTISTATEAAPTVWTDYVGVTEVYATNFRYVKITVAVAAATTDLVTVDAITVRLDVKLKNDAGSLTCTTVAGGDVVSFNVPFSAVTSITVSPQGTGVVIPVYDFAGGANPTSFKILLFNAAGARLAGAASWSAKGY